MKTTSIDIHKPDDLAHLRQEARHFMQDLQAPLATQSRVSWVTTFLAEQMLDLKSEGIIKLFEESTETRQGIRIMCSGWWLRSREFKYELHVAPIMDENDTVDFVSGLEPMLNILIWFQ